MLASEKRISWSALTVLACISYLESVPSAERRDRDWVHQQQQLNLGQNLHSQHLHRRHESSHLQQLNFTVLALYAAMSPVPSYILSTLVPST
jgi:hypothetical protein